MRCVLLTAIAMVVAGTLSGQEPSSPVPETETPQLIRTTLIQPGDSVLVQAAKRAVVARQSGKNRINIDDRSTRGRGHIFQSTGPVAPKLDFASVGSAPPPARPESSAEAINQQELQRKIDTLRQEQERMAAEAEEPYGGDVEEDRVDQRQAQIPQEIDQLQRQQTPSRPPS